MIFLALGKWNLKVSRWFTYKRFWIKGYIWTPFIRVRFREKPKLPLIDLLAQEKKWRANKAAGVPLGQPPAPPEMLCGDWSPEERSLLLENRRQAVAIYKQVLGENK